MKEETETYTDYKRVAAIHDISCVGRCSLTVALPLLSAAGIETNIIPTAILSTHTGEFQGYTWHDLTDEILPIAKHWATLNRHYDAVYTGYFGSIRQLSIVDQVFSLIGDKGTLRYVDPVMADNGRLYTNFSEDYVREMTKFCKKADIILPNITEACFMLGMDYRPGPYSKAFIEDLIRRLSDFGGQAVILTGVWFEEKKYGAAALNCNSGEITYALEEHIAGCFHGAGDVLASSFLAEYLNHKSISESIAAAVHFTYRAIAETKKSGEPLKYGLCFEQLLRADRNQ